MQLSVYSQPQLLPQLQPPHSPETLVELALLQPVIALLCAIALRRFTGAPSGAEPLIRLAITAAGLTLEIRG